MLCYVPQESAAVCYITGEQGAEAVAAPVNEDLNDEEDEAGEENALVESVAVEKKAAKAAAKQAKVVWVGDSQSSADKKQTYRYVFPIAHIDWLLGTWLVCVPCFTHDIRIPDDSDEWLQML